MSAEDILADHDVPDRVIEEALKAHAHELAEKLRNEKILPPVDVHEKHINSVIELLAAKIDPYAK